MAGQRFPLSTASRTASRMSAHDSGPYTPPVDSERQVDHRIRVVAQTLCMPRFTSTMPRAGCRSYFSMGIRGFLLPLESTRYYHTRKLLKLKTTAVNREANYDNIFGAPLRLRPCDHPFTHNLKSCVLLPLNQGDNDGYQSAFL